MFYNVLTKTENTKAHSFGTKFKACSTTMHSCKMRTVCSSSHVYPSMHWAGGCIPACTGQGGVCIPACTGAGGDAQGGVCQGGSESQHALRQKPPPWTEWLTNRCKNITFLQLRLQMVTRIIPVGCIPSAAVAARGCLPGGVSAQGVSAQGNVCHPLLWTEWEMPVKTLPCRNYVADGKKA